MPIRVKSLLILMLSLVGLIGVVAFLTSNIITPEFLKIENTRVHYNLERVRQAYNLELENLNAQLSDWAIWDDSYQFMADQNQEYITSNIQVASMQSLHIEYAIYVSTDERIIYSVSYKNEQIAFDALPEDLRQSIEDEKLLIPQPDQADGKTGLLLLSDGPLLFAAQPIVTSTKAGPSRGTLIFARYIDSQLIEKLGRVTQLHLDFTLANSSSDVPEDGTIIPSGQDMYGYLRLNDVRGRVGLLGTVKDTRDIYNKGVSSVRYLVVALIVVGAGSIVLLWWVLGVIVIFPIQKLSADVAKLGVHTNKNFSPSSSSNEITFLQHNVRALLTSIAEAEDGRKRAIEENNKRDQLLRSISKITAQFLMDDLWEKNTSEMLEDIGTQLQLSRVTVFQNDTDNESPVTKKILEWIKPGVSPIQLPQNCDVISCDDLGMGAWVQELRHGKWVVGITSELPIQQQSFLRAQGVASTLIIPIMVNGVWWGCVRVDDTENPRVWEKSLVDELCLAVNVLGAAIERNQSEKQLKQQNSLMVGRELRMIELKAQIEQLQRQKS